MVEPGGIVDGLRQPHEADEVGGGQVGGAGLRAEHEAAVGPQVAPCLALPPPPFQASGSREHVRRTGGVMAVVAEQSTQLDAGAVLDPDEAVVGLLGGPDDLVELELDGHVVAVLVVLADDEQDEAEDGGAGGGRQLPGAGVVDQGAGRQPPDDRREEEDGELGRPGQVAAAAGDPAVPGRLPPDRLHHMASVVDQRSPAAGRDLQRVGHDGYLLGEGDWAFQADDGVAVGRPTARDLVHKLREQPTSASSIAGFGPVDRRWRSPDIPMSSARGLQQALHEHDVEPAAELAADLTLDARPSRSRTTGAGRSTPRGRRRCGPSPRGSRGRCPAGGSSSSRARP